MVTCASLIESKLWLKGTVYAITAQISALVRSFQSNEGWHGVVGDTALMRWGVAGREEEVKSDIPYREKDLSWKVNQTKDSDGTSDLLRQDELPPKESCESYCVNSAGKKTLQTGQSQRTLMKARCELKQHHGQRARTKQQRLIFFQILTRWGQYCFLLRPV